uniref:7TM_GPCR_Srx domain-containing protein n=1 Tax=Heligmosomoides polygyrus TaxID=6339 RepID=A0A183G6L9_HELPZ
LRTDAALYSISWSTMTYQWILGLWCAACMTCLILVINRLLDMWNKRLFQNNRTYLVLLFPTCYFLWFTFFTPPILFNSDHTAWFFATFAEGHDINLVCGSLSPAILRSLSLFLPSKLQCSHFQFFIQTSSICMANLIAALVYVYMQFFPTPSWLVMGGHICWQLGHGFPAFVYLFLNRTIQREALQMFGFRRIRTTVAHMSMPTSNKTPHTDS